MIKKQTNRISDLLEADWRFDESQPEALGCGECFLRGVCGGLRVAGGALDCLRFCCHKSSCEIVCFNNPALYAKRSAEVRGLNLSNIPRCDPVPIERLVGYAPLLHHGYRRVRRYNGNIVALSLFELIDRAGAPRFQSRSELAAKFLFSESAQIVISGVQKDHLLERVWGSRREPLLRFLADIKPSIVSAPNFSLYNNLPRSENLYNLKRIGWLAYDFQSAGLPTAWHVNAVTQTDYDNVAEFLLSHSEYGAISFEFITGAKTRPRMAWHVARLAELSSRLGRPMQLLVRGGKWALYPLSTAFENVLLIDSTPLQKALYRRQLSHNHGELRQTYLQLPKGTPVDDLLAANVQTVEIATEIASKSTRGRKSIGGRSAVSLGTQHAYDKAGQLNLLTDSSLRKPGSSRDNRKSMIAAPKAE